MSKKSIIILVVLIVIIAIVGIISGYFILSNDGLPRYGNLFRNRRTR